MIEESQERTGRLRVMLAARGKRLGESECGILWYVLDGMLYCDLSHTQLQRSGEYSAECDRLRRVHGRLPWEPYPKGRTDSP